MLSDGEVKAYDMTALLLDQKSLAGRPLQRGQNFQGRHDLPRRLVIVIVIVKKRKQAHGRGYRLHPGYAAHGSKSKTLS